MRLSDDLIARLHSRAAPTEALHEQGSGKLQRPALHLAFFVLGVDQQSDVGIAPVVFGDGSVEGNGLGHVVPGGSVMGKAGAGGSENEKSHRRSQKKSLLHNTPFRRGKRTGIRDLIYADCKYSPHPSLHIVCVSVLRHNEFAIGPSALAARSVLNAEAI